jgi:hypothetical protein
MSNLALNKTDRTRNVGAFLWLIVCKFFQAVSYLVKKINWRKVGFVSWRIIVLASGVALAIAKLAGSMIAGLWGMMHHSANQSDFKESTALPGDDYLDPHSNNPYSLICIEEDEKRR